MKIYGGEIFNGHIRYDTLVFESFSGMYIQVDQ